MNEKPVERDFLRLVKPTQEQVLILRRHRVREAEYLMGKGEQGNGPPDYPPEICDPLTDDLYP